MITSQKVWRCSLKLKSILQGPQELEAVDWVATELGIV